MKKPNHNQNIIIIKQSENGFVIETATDLRIDEERKLYNCRDTVELANRVGEILEDLYPPTN